MSRKLFSVRQGGTTGHSVATVSNSTAQSDTVLRCALTSQADTSNIVTSFTIKLPLFEFHNEGILDFLWNSVFLARLYRTFEWP